MVKKQAFLQNFCKNSYKIWLGCFYLLKMANFWQMNDVFLPKICYAKLNLFDLGVCMLIKKLGALCLLTTLSMNSLAVLPVMDLGGQTLELSPTTPLELKVLGSIVTTNPQGQEILMPMRDDIQLQSGIVLEYHGHVANQGTDIFKKITIALKIPENTELLDTQSISPNRAKGSIDGVNFQYMPLKTNINGIVQNIPNHFYKSVQWDIENIGAGEVATVKYRVKVK